MTNDNQELNERLAQSPTHSWAHEGKPTMSDGECSSRIKEDVAPVRKLRQWTTSDNKIFVPASSTAQILIPGVYEINSSQHIGIYFEKIPVRTEGLLRFPQTNCERIVSEIQKFWQRESRFRAYHLAHKRGILTWGPAGSGKSCAFQLVMRDVIEREGVVIKFTHPGLFTDGIRILREIQPTTKVVVVMEDLDAIIARYNESDVLNILDGVELIDRMVFLASTNYPERLGALIVNRPSRFDKRIKIGHPNAESRQMYFEHLVCDRMNEEAVPRELVAQKQKELHIDLHQWVADTEGFSLAHLKELFIAVVILEDDYAEAIETLSTMKEHPHSEDDREKMMGFADSHRKSYRSGTLRR